MGDRANVYVKDGETDGVYLYTHWGGDTLPLEVKKALAKRWRWDDPQYLARIIFDVMSGGRHGEETGLGITSRVHDNEHLIVQVDCDQRTVVFLPEGLGMPLHTWSFDEFVGMTDAAIRKAYHRG